jgi:hypothetical protein
VPHVGRPLRRRLVPAGPRACPPAHPLPWPLPRSAGEGDPRPHDPSVGAGPRACPLVPPRARPLVPPRARPPAPSCADSAPRPRPTLITLAIAVLALTLSGCSVFGSAASATPTLTPLPTIAPPATPIVADQVDRAKRLGPGFLDYCPRHEGAALAQYDVMLPGLGPIGGFCQTHISRQSGGDIITFYAHWDARSIHHGQGTITFTYGVSRVATPPATPVAEMLDQTGPLPP